MATTTSPDGITLHYETHGSGAPALVFVHGWCCNRHHWDQQLAVFSPQYQTVAIDLAGHGESGRDRETWTISAFGADVAAVVEALALEQIVLIGHSMGGPVIVEAARLLGDKVLGLVGVDYFHHLAADPTPDEIDQRLAPFRQDFVGTAGPFVRDMFNDDADPAIMEPIVAAMSAAPPEIAIEVLGAIMGNAQKMRDGLQALDIPKLTINSNRSPSDDDDAHGLKVLTMSNVGHFCMLDDPDTFNLMLREILKELVYTNYHRNRKRR